jgi:hypothetical protein
MAMGILIGGIVGLLALLIVSGVVIHTIREPGRQVRRKELASSHKAINSIDELVDRLYPQQDLVGQAMADDIRKIIAEHRKGTR